MAQPVAFQDTTEALNFLKGESARLSETQGTLKEFIRLFKTHRATLAAADATIKDSLKKKGEAATAAILAEDGRLQEAAPKISFIRDDPGFKSIKGGAKSHKAVEGQLLDYVELQEDYEEKRELVGHQHATLLALLTPDSDAYNEDLGKTDKGGDKSKKQAQARVRQVDQPVADFEMIDVHSVDYLLPPSTSQAPPNRQLQSLLRPQPPRGNPGAPSSAPISPLYMQGGMAAYGLCPPGLPSASNPAKHLAYMNRPSQPMPANPHLHLPNAIQATAGDSLNPGHLRHIDIKMWDKYEERKTPINPFLEVIRKRVSRLGAEAIAQHFQILFDCIKGEPKQWLLNQHLPDTVEELEQMLLNQFGRNESTATAAEAKLKQLRLQTTGLGSVDTLCWEFEKLFPLAHPNAHPDLKLVCFKTCLPAKYINQMALHRYTTYEGAVEAAKFCEAFPLDGGSGSHQAPPPGTARINVTTTAGEDVPEMGTLSLNEQPVTLATIQSMIDKKLAPLESYAKAAASSQQRHHNRSHPYHNSGGGQGNRRGYFHTNIQCQNCQGFGHQQCSVNNGSSRECHNCGGLGHFANQCQAPKRPVHVPLPERGRPASKSSPATQANAVPLNRAARGGQSQ